ncbi:hypothetical protein [Phenylobacterium sp.]|jgi:hypothetical protein|uniref:hypothetical protein n=1 Tax=Phenylobacterium sp. TaxID=1871053 RepID=UPI002F4158B0
MTITAFRPSPAAAILALAAGLALAPIASRAEPAAAYKAPRTAFGQPDIGGYWSNATLTPTVRESKFGDRAVYTPEEVKALENEEQREIAVGNKRTDPNAPINAPNGLESKPSFLAAGGDVGGYNRGWLDPGQRVMRVGGQPRTSLFTTKDGRPPARKSGSAAAIAGYATEAGEGARGPLGSFDNPENRPLSERCIMFGGNVGPPMLPNGFYNNDYNIVQTKDAVAIQVEMVHDVRVVRLNAQHRTDNVRPWFGDSVGRWEGDTLVVETNHIPQKQAFQGAWRDLTITERFTRTAKDRLRYSFTVSAPSTWDQPWGGEYEFSPLQGVIYEYACNEGNYALPGILAGARNAERAAASGKAASGANN